MVTSSGRGIRSPHFGLVSQTVLAALKWVFLWIALLQTPALAADRPSLSVGEAYQRSATGQILIIDIRSPHEWKTTGIPRGAIPISVHAPDMMRQIARAAGSKSRPIAVFCAIGGRSHDVQLQLIAAGYREVYNVREGMMGNEHGFGWKDQDLPIEAYDGPVTGKASSGR